MKRSEAMSVTWVSFISITLALGSAMWAAAAGKSQPTLPTPAPGSALVDKALKAMGGAEEIVFVVRGLYDDGHYYATFGHWSSDPNKMMHSPDGSRLCKLNLRTRQVTVLLDDPQGGFRDLRVHYDGGKLLFAYRKGGTKHYHLYESNADGTGLRQLTSGDCDDVDADYLPDGGIVFVSSRCNRFVPCYHTQQRACFTGWTPTAATSAFFLETMLAITTQPCCRTVACSTPVGNTWTALRRNSTACGP